MTARLSDQQRNRLLDAIALRRFGTAAEVAELIGFLVSERAGYLTGSVVEVHGGISL